MEEAYYRQAYYIALFRACDTATKTNFVLGYYFRPRTFISAVNQARGVHLQH